MIHKRVRKADELDAQIGSKIRQMRKSRGITMQQLAQHLGITHQQVQKYEVGSNRVPVSRLATIADLFGVAVSSFYPQSDEFGFGENPQPAFGSLSGEEVRLLKAFAAIPSAEARKSLLHVANQMAQSFKSSAENQAEQ